MSLEMITQPFFFQHCFRHLIPFQNLQFFCKPQGDLGTMGQERLQMGDPFQSPGRPLVPGHYQGFAKAMYKVPRLSPSSLWNSFGSISQKGQTF